MHASHHHRHAVAPGDAVAALEKGHRSYADVAAFVPGADPGQCFPGTDVVPVEMSGEHGDRAAPLQESDVNGHRRHRAEKSGHVALDRKSTRLNSSTATSRMPSSA